MSSHVDSTQAAEIQSVTRFEARTMGEMGRFLAKITANDAALAPYVEHIVFTADLFPLAEPSTSRTCQITANYEEVLRKEANNGLDDVLLFNDNFEEYEQALPKENDLEKVYPYSDTCSPACGIGCLLGREWSICKNLRSITLPMEWATADLPGHKHFWQYFDIQDQKQYQYQYRDKMYLVIGDTRAPGYTTKETLREFYVILHRRVGENWHYFNEWRSGDLTQVKHLIINLAPNDLNIWDKRELLSCDAFNPSQKEVQAMGIDRFMTSAVEAMFKGRNKIQTLVIPATWAQYFENSGAFPYVDWSMKYEAQTRFGDPVRALVPTNLLVVGAFRQSMSDVKAFASENEAYVEKELICGPYPDLIKYLRYEHAMWEKSPPRKRITKPRPKCTSDV